MAWLFSKASSAAAGPKTGAERMALARRWYETASSGERRDVALVEFFGLVQGAPAAQAHEGAVVAAYWARAGRGAEAEQCAAMIAAARHAVADPEVESEFLAWWTARTCDPPNRPGAH